MIFSYLFLHVLKKIVGYYCVEVQPDKKYLRGAKMGISEKPPKMKKNDFFLNKKILIIILNIWYLLELGNGVRITLGGLN